MSQQDRCAATQIVLVVDHSLYYQADGGSSGVSHFGAIRVGRNTLFLTFPTRGHGRVGVGGGVGVGGRGYEASHHPNLDALRVPAERTAARVEEKLSAFGGGFDGLVVWYDAC